MKKIYLISLSLFLIWGCGGGGDSPQAPAVSGGTLSITWNMSQSATVEENSNGATLIDATLNNSTATLSFSLSGTDSSKFSISNGYLVFTDTPDYENPLDNNADNTYSLTLNASGGGISSSHSFSLLVNNVNEAPSLVTDSSAYFQVNENLTEIKQITASDPESDALVFSLQNSSASEDEGLLQIDASTGIVSFKTAPNYESPNDIDANNTLVFTVAVSDGSFSASKKYYAAVVDVKENPTDISLSPSSVAENSSGVTFGTISLLDEDPVGIQKITISGIDAGSFEMGPGLTLKFKDNVSANYETKSTYSITLTIKDDDGITLTKSFSLTITDVNDPPTSVSIAGGSAAENSAGASFGTLSTTDQDAVDTFSYSVTGGTDAASFEIGSSNTLKFKSTVSGNFETKSSYTVIVTSTDSGLESASSTLTLSLTNVNESPTDIALSGGSAAENSAGASFGTLSTTDPDASDSFTYTVTGGTDAASFEIGSSNTLKFKSTVAANFESKSSYSVTITSTDAGSNAYAETLTVSITNVNEIPVISDLSSSISLAENLTSIVTVSASDEEGSTLTYTVTGTDASSLSISSAGVLTFDTAPNYESKSSYLVTVNVSDGTNTTSQALTLTITDVNEAPTDIALSGGSAAENSAGASFGTLSTTDQDASESFTYSITGGTDAASFEIGSSNTLKFKSTVAANFESKSSYSVSVTSTDAGSNTYAETLTVSITNVNEAPSFTTSTASTQAENSTAVLTVSASDPESGSLTYSLGSGNDTAKFSITSAGVLTFNRAPDYEIPSDLNENNVYLVTILVSDGTSSTTLVHYVTITDVTEATGLETPDNVQTVETK